MTRSPFVGTLVTKPHRYLINQVRGAFVIPGLHWDATHIRPASPRCALARIHARPARDGDHRESPVDAPPTRRRCRLKEVGLVLRRPGPLRDGVVLRGRQRHAGLGAPSK